MEAPTRFLKRTRGAGGHGLAGNCQLTSNGRSGPAGNVTTDFLVQPVTSFSSSTLRGVSCCFLPFLQYQTRNPGAQLLQDLAPFPTPAVSPPSSRFKDPSLAPSRPPQPQISLQTSKSSRTQIFFPLLGSVVRQSEKNQRSSCDVFSEENFVEGHHPRRQRVRFQLRNCLMLRLQMRSFLMLLFVALFS